MDTLGADYRGSADLQDLHYGCTVHNILGYQSDRVDHSSTGDSDQQLKSDDQLRYRRG